MNLFESLEADTLNKVIISNDNTILVIFHSKGKTTITEVFDLRKLDGPNIIEHRIYNKEVILIGWSEHDVEKYFVIQDGDDIYKNTIEHENGKLCVKSVKIEFNHNI